MFHGLLPELRRGVAGHFLASKWRRLNPFCLRFVGMPKNWQNQGVDRFTCGIRAYDPITVLIRSKSCRLEFTQNTWRLQLAAVAETHSPLAALKRAAQFTPTYAVLATRFTQVSRKFLILVAA